MLARIHVQRRLDRPTECPCPQIVETIDRIGVRVGEENGVDLSHLKAGKRLHRCGVERLAYIDQDSAVVVIAE